MTVQAVTPILNVSSIADSLAWFVKLGWRHGFIWGEGTPTFGSVQTDGAEIFLCVGAQGSRGTIMPKSPGDDVTDGVWMSWWVKDHAAVDDMHALALSHGMTVTWPPTDEPWGVREFHLRHPDGHMFRVGSGTKTGEDCA